VRGERVPSEKAAAQGAGGRRHFFRLFIRFGLGRTLGLGLLIGFLAVQIWDPPPLQTLRLKTFDLYQILQPRTPQSQPVVVVDLDDETLAAFGQWPWPRTQVARLIDRLTALGAVVIGLDIVFPEPDRLSPARFADGLPSTDEALRAALRAQPDNDAVLAESLAKSRVVLGQAGHPRPLGADEEPLREASVAALGPDPRAFVAKMPGIVRNLPAFESAARGIGVFTLLPEQDGIVRRVPALVAVDDKLLLTLTLEVLRVATGQRTLLVKSDVAGINAVVVAGVEIPTDREGAIWVPYGPRDTANIVSAGAVLRDQLPAGALAGRLVLIGTSAAGLLDIKPTPLGVAMPGVEIHAQLLAAILSGDHLVRPNYAVGAEFLLTVSVGLLMLILVPRLGAMLAFLLGGGIAVVLVAGAWFAFSQAGLLLSVAYPLAASLLVYGLLVFHNYFHEERERRFVRGAFGQYLAPALVDELASRPDRLVLGGEIRNMTLLFADIRGFTGIAELYRHDPQGLTRLVNRLLTPLSRDIVQHRGTIDKYMGDAIMAFWNAPLDDHDHAANACRAALDMVKSLERLNEERAAEATATGEPFLPLRVGIGINSGECLVGNLGSDIRFDYSVMGDAVNLASRLEGQTKTYGVPVLVGEATAAAARHDFALLEIDRIRVVGKQTPERLFALLGGSDMTSSDAFLAFTTRFSAFLELYRLGQWKLALERISGLRSFIEVLPVAGLLEAFERRILELQASPPTHDWDGVYVAAAKN